MREDGYITTQQEYDSLKQLPYKSFATQSGMIKAPHFVFYVKDQLVARFGEQKVESGGLRVTTSLDWDIQKEAEGIISEEVKKIKPYKVGNGAAVVLNPKTGEILSMVGSRSYWDAPKPQGCVPVVSCKFDPHVNVSLRARQPGVDRGQRPQSFGPVLRGHQRARTASLRRGKTRTPGIDVLSLSARTTPRIALSLTTKYSRGSNAASTTS